MANVCMQCRSPLAAQTNLCGQCGFANPIAPKSSLGAILVTVFVVTIPVLGVLAVLGVYGVRKYIANAKTAEARNTLGQIAKSAVVTYEESRRLCASASAAVPANGRRVSRMKYQSTSQDWQVDSARNAGFACLKLEISTPQYFQYDYKATATGFVATAHGDLDGDGQFSTYEIIGQIVGDRLVIAPQIREVNPGE